MTEIDYSQLDERVIPMVRFFNDHGLLTSSSCQGHPDRLRGMFYIEFDPSVTKEMLIDFQTQHLDNWGHFSPNGIFCERFFYYDHFIQPKISNAYMYLAADADRADLDLKSWVDSS